MTVSKRLILAATLLLTAAVPALAQTTFTDGSPGTSTTSTTIGNTTFTNGTTYGQPTSTTSQTVGNTTFTSGTVAGQPYSSTSTTTP